MWWTHVGAKFAHREPAIEGVASGVERSGQRRAQSQPKALDRNSQTPPGQVVVTEYWYLRKALVLYMMTDDPLGAKPSVEGQGRDQR